MIEINDSSKEVLGTIKLWAGLTNMEVKAVNPNMAELNAMGINIKTEPNYNLEMNGRDIFKVVFWVSNPDLTTKVEFLLENTPKMNKDGNKTQWVNDYGQFMYAESTEAIQNNPKMEWYKHDGIRPAFPNEEKLIGFIRAWANVASGGKVSLDTMDKIASGTDLSELKQLVTQLSNNRVRVLVGVKDGKYQNVYTSYFGRTQKSGDSYFVKALNGEYSGFNAEIPGDLQWGQFTPQLSVTQPDEEKAPAETDDWV
jgi:hypothetical protein